MVKNPFSLRLKLYIALLIAGAALAVAAAFFLHFFIGHGVQTSALGESFRDKLVYGSEFTVDDIIKDKEYKYGWLKSSVAAEITVKDAEGKFVPAEGILDYDAAARKFEVIGVGEGRLAFFNPVDPSIRYEVDFATHFASADTVGILQSNYAEFFDDGIVTGEELASVTELTFADTARTDVSDFALCANLSRVIIESGDGVAKLDGKRALDENVVFFVNQTAYGEYLSASEWSSFRTRVFPIVNLDTAHVALVFELNGGKLDGIGDRTRHYVSLKRGGTISVAEYTPVRTGFTFTGWRTSADNGVTLSETSVLDTTRFEKDSKLYAAWRVNKYEVTYNLNAADADVSNLPASVRASYNETFDLSPLKPERLGYTFTGWARSADGKTAEFAPGEPVRNLTEADGENVVLYAVWATNRYNIVFDPNGKGNEVIDMPATVYDIDFDRKVTISELTPKQDGYRFIGWSMSETALTADLFPGSEVERMVSGGTVKLYAVWAANVYTIEYDANGGVGAPTKQVGKYGEEISLSGSTPSLRYFDFVGWALSPDAYTAEFEAGQRVSNLVSTAGGSISLYAVWTPSRFKLIFSDGKNPTTVTLTCNSQYKSLPYATATGHTFIGWSLTRIDDKHNTTAEFTGGMTLSAEQVNKLYDRLKSSENSIYMYGVWQVNSYYLTVQAKGESSIKVNVNNSKSGYVEYGTSIKATVNYGTWGWWNKSFSVTGVTGNKNGKTITFTMPANDVTIKSYSSFVP